MLTCDLLIPGLLPPRQWLEAGALGEVRPPALETLLARAGTPAALATNLEGWLCQAFSVSRQRDWPIAPLTLLADGGEPGDGYWLQAEPVHIQLQRDRLVLIGAAHLGLTPAEAASLTASLNRHFAEDGLSFSATQPGSWHLHLSAPAAIETRPLDEAIGRDVRHLLPGGAEAGRWHSLINEMQMLLYTHEINQAREQRNALTINSIWPWGGGTLPQHSHCTYRQVWARSALVRGLARLAGVGCHAPPPQASAWLEQAAPGSHLVVLDGLRDPALYGDLARWRDMLAELDHAWFRPLQAALVRGSIGRLNLYAFDSTAARHYTVSRSDLWKFWRRRKPLPAFFGEP